MKHHPMDDFLWSKFSARGRARGDQAPEKSDNSGSEINKALRRRIPSLDSHRRQSSRNIHRSEKPIYNANWHPLDQMLKDNAFSTRTTEKDGSSSTEESPRTLKSDLNHRQNVDRAPELGCETAPIDPDPRRSARVSSFKGAAPNYDMKYDNPIRENFTLRLKIFFRYHVMDSTLRPKASSKRLESKLHSVAAKKRSNKSASSTNPSIKQPAKASPKRSTIDPAKTNSDLDSRDGRVSPVSCRLQNPYLGRTSLDWSDIQPIDRFVYLLQKGAPLHGNTLSQAWSDELVKQALLNEGVIALDELNSGDSIKVLKFRYESVRLGLQKFFGSKLEPINKNDWMLTKMEGFDVYNMKRGSKYWRHQKDSVVEGNKTSSNSNILRSAAETAKRLTGKDDQGATTDNVFEGVNKSEVRALTNTQHFMDYGTDFNKSNCKWLSALRVDAEPRKLAHREDDGIQGVVSEAEDTLIESMREKHVASSIMSDIALKELVFFNELNSVVSEEKATDLNISSTCGLTESFSLSEDETVLKRNVGPHDESNEPQNLKMKIKKKKRESRVDVAIAVHEDLPGRTPLVEEIVSMNPASPGTDIPKENLEDDGSVEHSTQVDIRSPRTHQQHEAGGTLITRRVRHLGGTAGATIRYRSLPGRPFGSLSP